MSKSLIRTGGTWHNHNRPSCDTEVDCPGYSFYEGGKTEEGRFTSALAPMPTDPIRRLLATDGKAYKLFMKACQNPIGEVT